MDTIIKMARSALRDAKNSEAILKAMGFKPAVEVEIKSGSMVLMASAVLEKLYLVCIDEWTKEKRTARVVEDVETESVSTNVNIRTTFLSNGNYMLLTLSI